MPTGDRLPGGKLPAALLADLLRRAARPDPSVVLGPMPGEDAAAIRTDAPLLVAATDPITLTGEALGAFAVTVNANDVAVTGARPQWFLATVLLPPGTTPDAVRAVFDGLVAALDQLDATLVGGHTEITAAVNQPVVVGQMLGCTDRIVRTGGMRPGDVLLQVGPAPVEGAAVLAATGAPALADLDPDVLDAARHAADDPGISVVDPALRAAALGATAMHDPTEGGLAAGLHELAAASGVALTIDRDAVRWFPPAMAVCDALGADPWATIASGTLLAAFPPEQADTARTALAALGAPVAVLGSAAAGAGVVDTAGAALPRPERDEVARLADHEGA